MGEFFAILGILIGMIMILVGAIYQQNIILWSGVIILVSSALYYGYISNQSERVWLY